eukprot:GDKJ01010705.1.p1 GENE.GDKJ01010705.1~~GDKJ01010705.1.p1  ORF type:complete len:274 (+),score=65.53 GDKJ01010705.1:25-822(+)
MNTNLDAYQPLNANSDEKDDVVQELGRKIDAKLETNDFSIYHLILLCDVFAAVGLTISTVAKLVSWQFFAAVFCTVHLFICALLFIMNFPNWDALHEYRTKVRSFFRFMSLITGQSIVLLYLSLVFFVVAWPSHESKGGALVVLICFLCFAACFLCGLGGLLVALSKRRTLEAIRKTLQSRFRSTDKSVIEVLKSILGQPKTVADYFLLTDFPCFIQGILGGETPKETPSLTDSALLFNAIDAEGVGHLTVEQVAFWIETSTPWL